MAIQDNKAIKQFAVYDKSSGDVIIVNLMTLAAAVLDSSSKTLEEHVANTVTNARHMSDAEKLAFTNISTLLSEFNTANHVVKLGPDGKVPSSLYDANIDISEEAEDIATRDAAADSYAEGMLVFVVDASADPDVGTTATVKWAVYRKMSAEYETDHGVKFETLVLGKNVGFVLPTNHMLLVPAAVSGNVAKFGSGGQVEDSGRVLPKAVVVSASENLDSVPNDTLIFVVPE